MTVAGSGEPVDNWAAGAGANYFYSVANINRERRPGTSHYCCLILGWRQLQAAVCRTAVAGTMFPQFEQCDGEDVSGGGDGDGVGDGDGGEQHQFCIW